MAQIPGLTIIDSGYVTKISPPADKTEKMEDKKKKIVTLADLIPGVIFVDVGTITRIDGQPVKLLKT